MITAQDLSISIGDRQLVSGANFSIRKGDRIGLVGRNGAGKTTTMTLLAGLAEQEGTIAYSGQVSNSGTVGYLSQDPKVGDPEQSGMERVLQARDLARMLHKIAVAEKQMAELTGERQQKAMNRYVRLDHEFTISGGYAARAEAAQIAANLGLSEEVMKQPLHTLSGGQRRRVELARVLFSKADILLLDEPTNHLDHDSIIWLRDYLRSYAGGFMVITHSVQLLKDTVNQVFYMYAARGVIDIYQTDWDTYLRQRSDDEKRRARMRANAMKKAEALRAQGEKMRYKATKAVAAQQMLRRADELLASVGAVGQEEKVARLRFPEPASCGKVPLRGEDLTKTYGSLEVFMGVNLAIDRGSRVVVLGFNGAGKTTLLRLLAHLEEPDMGEVVDGHGLKLGYYAQEHETLDMEATVLENMTHAAPDLDDTHVRNVLGQFLFSGDDVYKPTKVLSGGEKTRLALATLVVSAANVLLLDEPTNNLDPASREEILNALGNYEGAVVLVTHDAGAVRALEPDRVILLPDGDEDLWDESYMDLVELK